MSQKRYGTTPKKSSSAVTSFAVSSSSDAFDDAFRSPNPSIKRSLSASDAFAPSPSSSPSKRSKPLINPGSQRSEQKTGPSPVSSPAKSARSISAPKVTIVKPSTVQSQMEVVLASGANAISPADTGSLVSQGVHADRVRLDDIAYRLDGLSRSNALSVRKASCLALLQAFKDPDLVTLTRMNGNDTARQRHTDLINIEACDRKCA